MTGPRSERSDCVWYTLSGGSTEGRDSYPAGKVAAENRGVFALSTGLAWGSVKSFGIQFVPSELKIAKSGI